LNRLSQKAYPDSSTVNCTYDKDPCLTHVTDRSTATSYYEQDGLGTVTSLSNASGALAQTYTFDSFGKQTASSGSLTNPFQYTGREFDAETSLYYYRARYYDPVIGRFISEDPEGLRDNLDMFAYVQSDTINSSDPYGLYVLKGFNAVGEVTMRLAIKLALETLHNTCCAGSESANLASTIENATFVYKPNLNPMKYCAQVGPLSFVRLRHLIGIGPGAFDMGCCLLPAVIIHEAVHLRTHGENKAYGTEEKCYGCKDPRVK
jgi:RHS repeat-associated protein